MLASLSFSSFSFYQSYSFYLGFFKGTSADQDRRFSDKELKLLKSIKFPPQFDTKVTIHSPHLHSISLFSPFHPSR
jgi:hypothetical protein